MSNHLVEQMEKGALSGIGLVATITLADVSTVLSILVGLLSAVYISLQIVTVYRNLCKKVKEP